MGSHETMVLAGGKPATVIGGGRRGIDHGGGASGNASAQATRSVNLHRPRLIYTFF
jgi:hypothetical protein